MTKCAFNSDFHESDMDFCSVGQWGVCTCDDDSGRPVLHPGYGGEISAADGLEPGPGTSESQGDEALEAKNDEPKRKRFET